MRKGLLVGLGMMAIGAAGVVAQEQPAARPARPGREARDAREAREARLPGRGGPGGPERLQRELGLSDEQAAQLRQQWQAERKEAIRRGADAQIARMELEEALDAPTLDEKLVAARTKSVLDLQAAATKARVDRRLALRKLLTPEQQAKMRRMGLERRGTGRAWRRHGRNAGRPGMPPAGGPGGGPGGPGGPAEDDEEPPIR